MPNAKRGMYPCFFMSFVHYRTGKRVFRPNGKPFCVWFYRR